MPGSKRSALQTKLQRCHVPGPLSTASVNIPLPYFYKIFSLRHSHRSLPFSYTAPLDRTRDELAHMPAIPPNSERLAPMLKWERLASTLESERLAITLKSERLAPTLKMECRACALESGTSCNHAKIGPHYGMSKLARPETVFEYLALLFRLQLAIHTHGGRISGGLDTGPVRVQLRARQSVFLGQAAHVHEARLHHPPHNSTHYTSNSFHFTRKRFTRQAGLRVPPSSKNGDEKTAPH
jgi:hypothetical protein